MFRSDDNKVAKLIERVIRPQIDAMIQPELLRWQEAVKQNKLHIVQIDVEKYLEDEAEEYRRVMQQNRGGDWQRQPLARHPGLSSAAG